MTRLGVWLSSPQPRPTPYTSHLWPNTGRSDQLRLDAGALLQLIDHLALSGGASVHQLRACTVPTCDWSARGFTAYLGPALRPWPWLSLTLSIYAGARWRSPAPLPPVMDPLITDIPPEHVSWVGIAGAVHLYW